MRLLARIASIAGLLATTALCGCVGQRHAEDALHQASLDFQGVRDDSDVLRSAPRDVIRAGELLARAERLAGYLGSGGDVAHYANLSSRYSAIAREHSRLNLGQEQQARLELERQRLQLRLREARLSNIQRQGEWAQDRIIALSTHQTDRGLVMTLGDSSFGSGQAELDPAANRTLLKVVQFLLLNPSRIVRIEGYTDDVGDQRHNLMLSRARAQTVADLLADLGIEDRRIQSLGYGDRFPVDGNDSERGRAQNRRVEIVFSDEKGHLSLQR